MSKDNFLSTLGGGPCDVQHLIDDAEESVKRGLNRISAVDGNIPMQDLLQDLGVSYEALAVVDQFFEQPLGVALVRVGRAHKVHGDVRIDQNHGWAPRSYPASISASMRSMSPVG